jgi:trigger factor
VKELKEKELPELNDDFAQEISEFETLAELRSTLETRFREEAEKKTKTNKQQALLDDLIEHLEADLPETMIEQEVDSVLTQTAMQLQRQGIDVKKLFTKDTVPQLRQRSRPEAIDRLKRSLALQEVAKKESIEVEPAAVEARVKELMAEYSGQDIDRDRLKEVVQEELLTDKIFVWLEEHSAIELVPEGSLQDDEEDEIDDAEIIEESTQPEASEATITVEATEAE